MFARSMTSDRNFAALVALLHHQLVSRLDLNKVAEITDPKQLRLEVRMCIERLLDTEDPLLSRMEREMVIVRVFDDTFGCGPLEVLFRDDDVQEIHVEGPDRVVFRRATEFVPVALPFRDLEQLYLTCTRLMSRCPGLSCEPNTTIEVEGEYFRVSASFPASRLESPTLHFQRLRTARPASEVPPRSFPRREQQLLIRFLKGLHAVGLTDLRVVNPAELRRRAEQAIADFFAEEPPAPAPEESARLVELVLNESLKR